MSWHDVRVGDQEDKMEIEHTTTCLIYYWLWGSYSLYVSTMTHALCHDMWQRTIFLFFYLLFITCTFTVGHMTDDLYFLTWLTWSHTLLSHVTHRLMTHVDSGWLIVTHRCFTHCYFIYICFIFRFMTHTRTPIVLVTYYSRDVHCSCDVYCSSDAIVHFTIKSGLLSSL